MLTVVIPATQEPVSVELARQHMRYIQGNDDGDIARAISSAREYVERETGVALAVATYQWHRGRGQSLPLLPATITTEDSDLITFQTAPGIVPEALRSAILLRVQAEIDADPEEADVLRNAAHNLAHLYRRNLGV